MYEKIIEEIKKTSFLAQIFFFDSSDPKDFDCMFVDEDQKFEFNHIKWLYMADHPYATLIGLMADKKIFVIDDEFEQYVLCNCFFDIPFLLAELSVMNSKEPKKTFLIDPLYEKELLNLKKYIKWCEENNFKLRKEDIDWINNN